MKRRVSEDAAAADGDPFHEDLFADGQSPGLAHAELGEAHGDGHGDGVVGRDVDGVGDYADNLHTVSQRTGIDRQVVDADGDAVEPEDAVGRGRGPGDGVGCASNQQPHADCWKSGV